MKRPKIAFLFRKGRRDRLAKPGEHPTEFLYGFSQLRRDGWPVSLIEDADLGMAPPLSPVARMVNAFSPLLLGLPCGMAVPLLNARHRRALAGADVVIATTNGMGLALAMGRAVGLVRVPVLLLAMGLVPRDASLVQRRLWPRLLRHIHLATISRAEQRHLSVLLKPQPIHYVPFGADAEFWTPKEFPLDANYVLAIGNDQNRDWPTLVEAWDESLPPLKIITSLSVPDRSSNVEVIRGDWRSQALTDEEIRSFYARAMFVIVPSRDTIQPAGQSACLQAMACGKAVIVSDIAGLWDRDLMADGQTVLLCPPGDARSLNERARRLAGDSALRLSLGRNAHQVVEAKLNTERMAASLGKLVESLLA